MHTGTRSWHAPLTLGMLALLAACATVPASRPSTKTPKPAPAVARLPTPVLAVPTPRTPAVEEGDAGDDTGFPRGAEALPTPALAALGATAAPAPDSLASAHPLGSDVALPSADSESLLPHIGPTTPPNVAAGFRLIDDGRQQLDHGQYDKALERFERGVAVDPTNAYGYYYLAQLYSRMQKYDQASAFAGRAAALAARNDRVLLARAYDLQGTVFEAVGRYADARTAYQKAVQADPNNAAARVGMGRLGQ